MQPSKLRTKQFELLKKAFAADSFINIRSPHIQSSKIEKTVLFQSSLGEAAFLESSAPIESTSATSPTLKKSFFAKIPPVPPKAKSIIIKIIFVLMAIYCLTPWCSSGVALLLGIILGVLLENPYLKFTKNLTPRMLAYSVIGLGAGMNLKVVGEVGLRGVGYTACGIFLTGILGFGLSRLLKISRDSSALITVGTAICGGSAIAAIAPILRAKDHDISISLATVFLLNSVALFLFPPLGHYFHLTQEQFGLWGALAIHDTSSVVGATMLYGARALQIGTTVKLSRALWIIPVSLFVALALRYADKKAAGKNTGDKAEQLSLGKIKKPWFILGFIYMAALVTYFPHLQVGGNYVALVAKQCLVFTLFLIGSGLSKKSIKEVGFRPLLMGITLWIIVGSSTLLAIKMGMIHE